MTRTKESWNIGENNPKAKLDDDKVIEIRRLVKSGLSLRAVASMYGVTSTCIFKIRKYETWKHVK